jgi:glycosyltransferase involved in cell wall biosynthesis
MSCKLTVLMAVYNGGVFLPAAMDSILRQTYPDFHFLIVDDASTDDTCQIVRSYSDKRIELLCLKENVGQTAALNIGLRHASTPWIARMDADDYSAPTRLEEQMRALDGDNSLCCVGTHAWFFHDDPKSIDDVIATSVDYAGIKKALLKGSPIIHGSMIVSRTVILDVGAYDERYRYAADLELFERLLAKHNGANIPKRLLGIRRHPKQGARTIVSHNEAIEILTRRLSNNTYSREDAAAVRASLSRAHVVRSRHLGGQRNYAAALKDLSVAFRLSRGAFVRSFLKSYVGYIVPERKRAQLRWIFERLKASVTT